MVLISGIDCCLDKFSSINSFRSIAILLYVLDEGHLATFSHVSVCPSSVYLTYKGHLTGPVAKTTVSPSIFFFKLKVFLKMEGYLC